MPDGASKSMKEAQDRAVKAANRELREAKAAARAEEKAAEKELKRLE